MNLISVIAFIRREPVTISGVITVVLGWLAQLGVPAGIVAGVGTIVGLLIATLVRGGVTTTVAAAASTTAAVVNAVTEVATKLDKSNIGVAGTVTPAAAGIITEAVDNAVGVLAGVGKHK